ncbi:phosphopantetheine-binding protein [Streptomyces sp. NBC_01020]|uniref:acyl carrier protein n=1 Tax=unclassified Streptomyces TaxID=2593676 RepID=UPI002253DAD5|nr:MULTISPECIES: acyl carrier protein [unclassified Streptomyces]MCX4727914.1 phosphopantetheine-binding protein [Streptomyces sp. NBC_01306]WSV02893.1 phosphopantetheine-binding protein [Streptomyces sp. NBC_01020]WSX40920.1 phosphopantetheine-binding protein [Streptomyces sp. NBC_00963]
MDSRFTELLRPFLKNAGPDVVITPGTDLRRLGVDSMQAIELLFSVEDTFGISLPDEELNDTTFATAGSLWHVISAQLSDGSAGQVGA